MARRRVWPTLPPPTTLHAAVCAAAVCCFGPVDAAFGQDEATSTELLVGRYLYVGRSDGSDLELHHSWRNDRAAWVGIYHDSEFGSQWRVGLDFGLQSEDGLLRVLPTLQAASRGFVAASVNARFGQPWYGMVGFGRTNGREFYSRDFNPNDMLSFGVGWENASGSGVRLVDIRDNRFGTGRNTHLIAQWQRESARRWELDLVRVDGRTDDGERLLGWGLSLASSSERWTARVAYDPHQNFTRTRAWRFTLGRVF